MAIDRFLVNQSLKDAYVPGSYRIRQPADPANPDSDHLAITCSFDFAH